MMENTSKDKWLPVHPDNTAATDKVHNIDDSLTSLDWLQTFSIIPSLEPERRNGVSPSPRPPVVLHPHSSTCLSFRQGSTHSPSSPYGLSGDGYYPYIPLQPGLPTGTDYNKTDPKLKPLHTYASLISMAIQASKQPKVGVSYIYDWILHNFSYYKHTEFNWQRAIRYTLSINKCFLKVRRGEKDKGKGGYWRINPQHAHMFVNGIYNSRKKSESYLNYKYNISLTQNGLPQDHDTVAHGQHTAAVQSRDTAVQGCDTTLRGYEEAHGTDILQASMASIFDNVPDMGNCNEFEELVEELASSYCEKEASVELGQGVVEEGVAPQNQTSSQHHHHHSYGYTELSGATLGYHITTGDLCVSQQQHPLQDLLPNDHHPLYHQLLNASTPFPPQFIPLTLDQDFGPCDGFMNMLKSNVYFA